LFGLKRYVEAEQDMNKSLVLDPTRAAVYMDRGVTLTRLGREVEAFRDFQKSCELKNVIACYAVQQFGTNGAAVQR
jgi:Flp pilus assembly protein TadD